MRKWLSKKVLFWCQFIDIYLLHSLWKDAEQKGALLYSPVGSIVRPAELHSLSAEKSCLTENTSSLRSVKVATPPCTAYAVIPCVLAVRRRF